MALDGKRARTWQEIADDASQEKDREKLKALSRLWPNVMPSSA